MDNILIDEARTPLIISGPAHDDVTRYAKADKIARQLKKDVHFEVKEKEHSAHLTDEGVREAEQLAGVESFYTAGNMDWPHLIDNALKAHHLYKRDVNYVVTRRRGGHRRRVHRPPHAGPQLERRPAPGGRGQGRRPRQGRNQTYATITLQNFFKLYKKICGMTGTAMTEANEFWKIYKLDVIAIPTNRAMQRINYPDVIYRSEREKYEAIADEIERMHKWDIDRAERRRRSLTARSSKRHDDAIEFQADETRKKRDYPARQDRRHRSSAGRPILVGTVSIEKSERLSRDARPARREAPGAQRQASPARGRDHRPGRPQERRDHRHEHGRPRHRHHPRRQSRDDGLGHASEQICDAARRAAGRMDALVQRDRAARANEGRRAAK